MGERISENDAILAQIKRLRRFALTLTSDQQTADSAVLAVISEKKDMLSDPRDFGRIYHSLLREVYQVLYDQSDRRRKLALMKPEESEGVAALVKLQSLDFEERAIISLFMVEQLTSEEIGSILERTSQAIEDIITEALQFLSRGSGCPINIEKDATARKVSI